MSHVKALFSELGNNTATHKSYIRIQKALAHLNSNTSSDTPLPPETLKTFKEAQKYHFLDACFAFACAIHKMYLNEEDKRAEAYGELARQYNRLLYLDNQIRVDYQAIAAKWNKSRANDQEFINMLLAFQEKYERFLDQGNAQINHRIYLMMIALAYSKNDHSTAIEWCKTAIEFFDNLGIERTAPYFGYMVPALTIKGSFEQARKHNQTAMARFNKGRPCWSVFAYQGVVNELHAKEYDKAYALFLQTKNQIVGKAMKEQWLILKAYIVFLSKFGKLVIDQKFRLGKFVNEVPIFSKDKAGNNINIIILQILLRLKNNKSWIIDNEEAILKYTSRRLRQNVRAKTFIYMLLKMAGYSNFNMIDELLDKEIKVLRESEYKRQIGIEVFPYLDLCGIVLSA